MEKEKPKEPEKKAEPIKKADQIKKKPSNIDDFEDIEDDIFDSNEDIKFEKKSFDPLGMNKA